MSSSSWSWRGRAVLIGAVFVLLPIIACQVILGIDHNLTTANVADSDTAVGPVAVTRCRYGAAPPGPPDAANGTSLPALVFAMHYQNFSGRDEAGVAVGYDLDGVCTCDSRDESINAGRLSCEAKDSGGPARLDCDNDGGVDNALEGLTRLFQLATGNTVQLEGDIDRRHECGSGGFLVVLSGYNGAADDPEVFVGILVSYGIRDSHDAGGEVDASCTPEDPPIYAAKHDGTDKWSVRTEDRPTDSLKVLLPGYVTDHRLVLDARFTQDVSIRAVVLSNVLSLSAPVLTATLVPTPNQGNGFRLTEGFISGRAPANDVLTSLAQLRLPDIDGGQFCNTDNFDTARKIVCNTVDTVTPIERDFHGDPCNAISITMQFEAEAAQLGRTYDPTALLTGCAATFPTCP